jgi:hypothetical protein
MEFPLYPSFFHVFIAQPTFCSPLCIELKTAISPDYEIAYACQLITVSISIGINPFYCFIVLLTYTATKIPFKYSFSGNLAASVPNFHIHVSVSDFYIRRISPHIFPAAE